MSNSSGKLEKLDIPGLPNGYIVDPGRIWRSGQPEDCAWPELARAGCRSVLDLNNPLAVANAQKVLAEFQRLTYASIPWQGAIPPSQIVIMASLRLVDILPPPVLIHCEHGSDRTGTLCAIWRMYHDHWTFEAAMKEAFLDLGFQGMHEFWFAGAVAEYARAAGKSKS